MSHLKAATGHALLATVLACPSCATPEQGLGYGTSLVVGGLAGIASTGAAAAAIGSTCGDSCETPAIALGVSGAVSTVLLVAGGVLVDGAQREIDVRDCRLFCELGTASQCDVIRTRCLEAGLLGFDAGDFEGPDASDDEAPIVD